MEKDVKARTKGEIGAAKTLCSPFDQPTLDEGTFFSWSRFVVLFFFWMTSRLWCLSG